MNGEEQEKGRDLVDSTDCLEAIGVFREWKNFLFVLILACLVLLQVCFWLVNTGMVKVCGQSKIKQMVAAVAAEAEKAEHKPVAATTKQVQEVEQAAKQVAAVTKKAAEPAPKVKRKKIVLPIKITYAQISSLVTFLNFIVVPAAVLYCLTMMFCLKVSLVGRLGGINHIARAFFISLVFVVLLLPWQRFFAPVVAGVIYTPKELADVMAEAGSRDLLDDMIHYLRFTGYWLLVVVLLICSQVRSVKWSKATLQRLEIV